METIIHLGYQILTRVGGRGTYYLWWNGKTGRARAELGFFSSVDQAKESIRIHKEEGRWLTESDPEIKRIR